VKVVVVSSYPPRHCGIGAYAAAQVDRLRAEGHDVTVISPPDGAGDVRVGFFGGRPFREAARVGRHADRIIVHYQPALYFRRRAPLSKMGTALALRSLLRRRRQTEVVMHEADPPRRWRPDEILLRSAFRTAPRLLFHTDRERTAFERAYRLRVDGALIRHTEGVRVTGPRSRPEARRRLGLPDQERILVAAGFLHPGKGLDRAMEAFAGPGRLVVVGSVKDPTTENLAHAGRLRALAASLPGVELIERFVDDQEFDAWVAAADAVVLPYRRSWSSGVLARAQAIGTPAVVADVGGLAEQASDRDVVVADDEQLRTALARIGVGARR
jgi:glycosyltransferase involved in cell wall biosynthesis